jgi:hypothetical protein
MSTAAPYLAVALSERGRSCTLVEGAGEFSESRRRTVFQDRPIRSPEDRASVGQLQPEAIALMDQPMVASA